MPRDHMRRVARLLAVTIVMTFVHVGAGLSQTQPQIHTLGSPGPGGGAAAAASWKKECETRADEKGLKGSKRTSVIAKCVKLGALPPELK
jgi:hypothetical protein